MAIRANRLRVPGEPRDRLFTMTMSRREMAALREAARKRHRSQRAVVQEALRLYLRGGEA